MHVELAYCQILATGHEKICQWFVIPNDIPDHTTVQSRPAKGQTATSITQASPLLT